MFVFFMIILMLSFFTPIVIAIKPQLFRTTRKKGLFINLVVVIFASIGANNFEPTEAPQTQQQVKTEVWSEGGTLHDSVIKDWKQASYKNKLATSADWALASEPLKAKIIKSSDFDQLLPFAKELVVCVDTTVKDNTATATDNQKSVSIAALCALMKGWTGRTDEKILEKELRNMLKIDKERNTTSDEQVRNEVATQPSVRGNPEEMIKAIVASNTPEAKGHTECSWGLLKWMSNQDAPIKIKKFLADKFDQKPFTVLRDNPFKAKYKGRNIINYKTDKTIEYSCIFDLENDSTSYALEVANANVDVGNSAVSY